MISLFIDTSSSRGIVAITKDNNVLYFSNEDKGVDLSSNMLPLISEAFLSAKVNINDIDKIFVVVGPGSFTGIRVGVTIAKTIAWSLKKDIIPISRLELLASSYKGYVIPLIDARRNYVYAGIYKNGKNIEVDKHIFLDDLILLSKKYEDVKFVSYDEFDNLNCNIPKIDVLEVIERHANDKVDSPHKVNPKYLKNTEAEEKLKNG